MLHEHYNTMRMDSKQRTELEQLNEVIRACVCMISIIIYMLYRYKLCEASVRQIDARYW